MADIREDIFEEARQEKEQEKKKRSAISSDKGKTERDLFQESKIFDQTKILVNRLETMSIHENIQDKIDNIPNKQHETVQKRKEVDETRKEVDLTNIDENFPTVNVESIKPNDIVNYIEEQNSDRDLLFH